MSAPRKIRLGTLTVLSSLLLFSAGIRVLGVSSAAFALDSQDNSAMTASKPQDSAETPPALEKLLTSFQTREAALVEDEERLSNRFEKLERTEAAIAKKMQLLTQSESRLRELLAFADVAAEDDVARLTSVYENMKPKAAAIVFEEMPPAFAAGFLSRMVPAAAAAVMANLQPQTAYAISVVFAGRNAETATK